MLILSILLFIMAFIAYFKVQNQEHKYIIIAISCYIFGLYCLSGV